MARHLCQAVAILILSAICGAQVDNTITLSAIACQGSPLYLLCPLGFYIKVTGGLHGRLDFTTCASGATVGSTTQTCIATDNIEAQVGRECDGRNLCTFSIGDQPVGNCTGINMYISIQFKCHWPSTEKKACQDEPMELSCPDDRVIKITEAKIGRTEQSVCTNATSNLTRTCDSRKALSFGQELCDGTDYCRIAAGDHLTGGLCPGQMPLLISYSFSCIECENGYNDSYCEKMALKGACDSEPNWMTIHCLKTCLRCHTHKLCDNAKSDKTCFDQAAKGSCSNPAIARSCERSCTKCKDYDALSTIIPPRVTPTTVPPACVNDADEALCHNSAILGECESGDSIVMLKKCYRSCSGCNATECEDLLEDCPTMASKGDCTNEDIKKKCPVSCNGTCDLEDLHPDRDMECTNIHHDDDNCDFWAMTGECDINAYWMRKNCYKACTKCHLPNICDNNMNKRKCDAGAAKNKCNDREFTRQCPQACGRCPDDSDGAVVAERQCMNKHNSDADCYYWKLQGECEANPDWMRLNCYKGCSECLPVNASVCENVKYDSDCNTWLNFGECETNAVWMNIYCYKTCSHCDLPDCANKRGDERCSHWASIGECEMNAEWMEVNCKKACRKCDDHLNETALCEALYNATHANETMDGMTTTVTPLELTTMASEFNMTACEMIVAEGNCSIEEFALLCPEECYNVTCNGTGLVYEHPVIRDYEIPEVNYGTSTCDGEFWVVCPPSYSVNVTSVDFYAEDKEYCAEQEKERRLQTEWWIVEQEMKAAKKGKKKSPPEMHEPCEDPNLLQEVKAKCDGKSWCFFNMSESNYTHTCPNEEVRFLNISFSCSEPSFHGKSCLGMRMGMRCWSHQGIKVHQATFGRQEEEICPVLDGSDLVVNKTCNNPHATKLVSELCNYNSTCDFDTSTILFGDPCPGVHKYLTVDFSCVECANAHHSEAHCEHWSNIGECEKNPGWMLAYCRKSCTRCHIVDTCNNTYYDDHQCNYWATIGECKRNPDWMIDNCQRSCNRCPDTYELPPPLVFPTRIYPNASEEESYDQFYLELYMTDRWHRDYRDRFYNKSKVVHQIVNETLWKFYAEAFPDTFDSLTHLYLRKSQITPWVIVGYLMNLNVNVTEAEAVEYECAIIDFENGTISIDNDTKIIPHNDTKIQCKRREGYCQFGAPWLRKGNGIFYCKCTGEWAGDRCNDIPIWGKATVGAIGGLLVIIIIIVAVAHCRKRRRQKPDDKTELVTMGPEGDTVTVDDNLNLKGVSEIEVDPELEHRPVTPDLLHNRKRITIPRLPLAKNEDEDKKKLRLEENEEHGTTKS